MAIGMFNTEPRKKHPLADIVVALEQNPFKVLLMFVSVKGPEEIAVSGSRLLSKRKVQGDIKALRQARRELRAELNSPDATYRVSLSLVYVLSKEQTEKELEKFRDVVSGLKCKDISVTVVSDMSTFLPPFAHRLKYLTEIALTEKIKSAGDKGI